MVLRNRLMVQKKSGEKKVGRGFSREELKNAGISLKQALHIGMPVDVRRRTVHDENVTLAKQQSKRLETVKKRASKTKRKIS